MSNDFWLTAGAGIVGWFIIRRRMSAGEARFLQNAVSLAVAGGCVWFAWWVLAARCAGGC